MNCLETTVDSLYLDFTRDQEKITTCSRQGKEDNLNQSVHKGTKTFQFEIERVHCIFIHSDTCNIQQMFFMHYYRNNLHSFFQADGTYLSPNKIFLANSIRMFWKKNDNKVKMTCERSLFFYTLYFHVRRVLTCSYSIQIVGIESDALIFNPLNYQG